MVSYSSPTSSDPAPLRRPAAVVRLRGDVLDSTDLEAGGLQRADRGLTTGPGALHEHVHLLHAVLGGLSRGVLRRHLRRVRRGLARTLEPDVSGRGPRDHSAQWIRDRDDRVVESALDVRMTMRNILLLLAANLLGSSRPSLRWHMNVLLELPRVVAVLHYCLPLAGVHYRSGIGVQPAQCQRAGIERSRRNADGPSPSRTACDSTHKPRPASHFLAPFFLPATV